MKAAETLLLLFTHPSDVRTLIQYWLWQGDQRDLKDPAHFEATGYNRDSMKKCWDFLELTSRSFTAVIMQLEGELARVICLYYLVLRGLDTIEDDMTIPDDVKQPLLRSFHVHTVTPGWNFKDSGPNEADRALLVDYQNVITELLSLPAKYRTVIIDMCQKMEVGMADYAHKAFVDKEVGVDTYGDLDLYCHYVAGLVGEGLVGLFAASGKESPVLANQLTLANHMGLFLQKTNILRDFREDIDEGRLFWPREAHRNHGFTDAKDMYKKENQERALWVLSEVTLDILRHATYALDFLSVLKNQSIFNFCAIPQSMAIATLSFCFMNPMIFHKNQKIRRAEAAGLIMRSTNPREVAHIFRSYARTIHHKTSPRDPNYLALSLACGKIDQWCEHHYPSFVHIVASSTPPTSTSANPIDRIKQMLDPHDARTRIYDRQQALISLKEKRKLMEAGVDVEKEEEARDREVIRMNKERQAKESQDRMDFAWVIGGAVILFFSISLSALWVFVKFWPDSQ